MPDEQIELSQLRSLVQDAGHAWRVREALFSDQEFDARLGVLPDPSPTEAAMVTRTHEMIQSASAPWAQDLREMTQFSKASKFPIWLTNRWDWRDHGIIGDVRDQGQCGSCVSFAVTGLVGAMAAQEHGSTNLHLSEAELHFCSAHGASCGGWWPAEALQVVKDKGVIIDSAFDYATAFDSPPQWDGDLWRPHCGNVGDRTHVNWKITDFAAVIDVNAVPIRKTYLRSTGPLVACFDVYTDFNYYGGGVYKHTTGSYRGGHAVLVVGYDDGDSSWICRNSWGSGFGGPAQSDGTGGGYFKIGYGECKFDTNTMYGCTGTQPPPSQWLQKLTDHLRYQQLIHPGDPVEHQVVDVSERIHSEF